MVKPLHRVKTISTLNRRNNGVCQGQEQKLPWAALTGGKFPKHISERKREDLNGRSEIKNRESEKAFFCMSWGNSEIHISLHLLLSREPELLNLSEYTCLHCKKFTQRALWRIGKANTHEIVPAQLLMWKANPFENEWIDKRTMHVPQQGLYTLSRHS